MASLTLENLPDSIWKPLVERAKRHGRSVEEEAVDLLGLVVGSQSRRSGVEQNLQTLNEFRESLADLFVKQPKDLGRATDAETKPPEPEV
jgi:plasmid stability protein